jgi:hypothetical protein
MNLTVIFVAVLASSLALIAYRLRQNRILPGDVPLRTSRLLQVGASPRVADLLARGDRLSAIKAYREEHQVGLREGKEQIERFERVLRHIPPV